MELGLKGKVALVTGSSKGIGRAVAEALAAEGARVAVTARSRQELEAAAEAIRRAGGTVLALAGDALSPQDIRKVVEETVARFGALHILINNVGGAGRFAPFHELTDEDWMALFELNVLSTVRYTRAALRHMQKQKWGRIINIASESGTQPDPEMPHYNATKGAMLVLSKSLSKAYARDGILVNTVSPAFIRTPLVEGIMAREAEKQGVGIEEAVAGFLEKNRPHIELRRPGTAQEVAAVVAFLASEAASFVTGANYRVDGGSVASV